MSKNSSPLRHEPQPRKAAQPLEEPLNTIIKYMEESPTMRLDGAMGYFSSCLPKAFRVSEGAYSPKGREGVAKGDIFIVCLKKPFSSLKLRSAASAPGNDSVTVPVVTRTEFALVPLSGEGNETGVAIRSWEGVYQSVTEFFESRKCCTMPMPAALKILGNALDHNKQMVPAKTILFNIHQVSRRVGPWKRCGIKGMDCNGTVHKFLEGEESVYFSTMLFDVKCLPMYFTNVLQFPQTARVYLHPNKEEEEEEVNLLQNLSTVTITEVSHGQHLVVRKLSDDGNQLGPAFTVPLNADLKVVAIKLQDSHLLDNISDQRCIVRARSSPSIGPTHSQADSFNHYDDPWSEVTRDNFQERKGCQLKEAYYNADTLKLKKYHEYVNVQVAVAFVPKPVSTGSTAAGASDQDHIVMGDESDIYEYMQGSKMTSSVTPHNKKLPLYPGSPAQPLAVPCKHQKHQKDGHVASLGSSSVTPAKMGDSHQLPCLDWQKLHPMEDRGIDEAQEYAYVQVGIPTQGRLRGLPSPGPPSPPPQHTKPKQQISLPLQLPHVLPCPQKADRCDEDAYEDMIVEEKSTQQEKMNSGRKLPQPQASRSLPVKTAQPDHSPKPKPKGVPSTAIPLTPFPSTRVQQSPCVHKKPIMLTSRPKEPELRYHVAANLGQDWRRVCTYLDLPLHQLDQADAAHSQLEDKAMQALVMWLRGQEDPKAPHSWETLLQALRWAKRNDLASDVERGIKNGTLAVVVANYK